MAFVSSGWTFRQREAHCPLLHRLSTSFPRRASEVRACLSLRKPWSQPNLRSRVVVQLRALLAAPKALFHGGLLFLWLSQHLPPVAPPDGRSRSVHTSEVRPLSSLWKGCRPSGPASPLWTQAGPRHRKREGQQCVFPAQSQLWSDLWTVRPALPRPPSW